MSVGVQSRSRQGRRGGGTCPMFRMWRSHTGVGERELGRGFPRRARHDVRGSGCPGIHRGSECAAARRAGHGHIARAVVPRAFASITVATGTHRLSPTACAARGVLSRREVPWRTLHSARRDASNQSTCGARSALHSASAHAVSGLGFWCPVVPAGHPAPAQSGVRSGGSRQLTRLWSPAGSRTPVGTRPRYLGADQASGGSRGATTLA